MHILIVDDHAFVCEGLKATLIDTLDDIQVTTTERGEEVLSILSQNEIDLIILDLFKLFFDNANADTYLTS